jgi:pimeloyl-ACP methyl ester carboxylesterase
MVGQTETHRIMSGDIELAVRVAGQGKLVILMHGWPELGLSWRHQIGALAAAGYRVAVPDMRGYGESAKPAAPERYTLDQVADDMAAIAASLGAPRWVAVGHDWGAPCAWRCALRFPDSVAAVFGLSVPHSKPPPVPFFDIIDRLYPDRFFYMQYFQDVGVAEAELAASDLPAALKRIYYSGSGQGVAHGAIRPVPREAKLLDSFAEAPDGPLPFMADAELDRYATAFRSGGWTGPLNWYRNFDRNARDAAAYGDNVIRQPAGFLAGEHEVVLKMLPGQMENMRDLCADLRMERSVAGAGHWIQQERPEETNAALIEFLVMVRETL